MPGKDPDETAPVGDPAVTDAEPVPELPLSQVQQQLASLPSGRLRHDLVTDEFDPARFFPVILTKGLDNTPVIFHRTARELRG